MKKRIIPILIVVAVAAVAGFYLLRRWNGDGADHIAFSGNIELTEVKMSFKTAGRMVDLLVKEGDTVKKGAVIARLDRDQLSSQRDAQRAALASAESQLAQLLTSIDFQRETYQGGMSVSQADLAQADARLRELQSGSRPQEIQVARSALDTARTEETRAASDWQRAQTLYKNDDISTAQFDQFRTQFERASAQLKQAEQQLALVVEGPRKETIEASSAQVDRAKAALRLANTPGVELKRREQEVAARGNRACAGASGAGRLPTGRHRDRLPHRRRGAREIRRARRDRRRRRNHRNPGRYGSSLAPRLRQRDPARPRQTRRQGARYDRLLPGQDLRGARVLHLLAGRIHTQADPDP